MSGCPYGDPACPCQDGDPCHYEPDPATGTAAMSPPLSEHALNRALEGRRPPEEIVVADIPTELIARRIIGGGYMPSEEGGYKRAPYRYALKTRVDFDMEPGDWRLEP